MCCQRSLNASFDESRLFDARGSPSSTHFCHCSKLLKLLRSHISTKLHRSHPHLSGHGVQLKNGERRKPVSVREKLRKRRYRYDFITLYSVLRYLHCMQVCANMGLRPQSLQALALVLVACVTAERGSGLKQKTRSLLFDFTAPLPRSVDAQSPRHRSAWQTQPHHTAFVLKQCEAVEKRRCSWLQKLALLREN